VSSLSATTAAADFDVVVVIESPIVRSDVAAPRQEAVRMKTVALVDTANRGTKNHIGRFSVDTLTAQIARRAIADATADMHAHLGCREAALREHLSYPSRKLVGLHHEPGRRAASGGVHLI
jgi:hypothetical protein